MARIECDCVVSESVAGHEGVDDFGDFGQGKVENLHAVKVEIPAVFG